MDCRSPVGRYFVEMIGRKFRRCWAVGFVLLVASLGELLGQGSVSGAIRVGGLLTGVADAVVSLDRDADPAVVDYRSEADPFGLFSISNVVAGQYTLRVWRSGFEPTQQMVVVVDGQRVDVVVSLVPLVEPSFDLSFEVNGVVSSLPLSRVPVSVARYQTATDPQPAEEWSGVTDVDGAFEFSGAKVGFYRFNFNTGPQARPKWLPYSTTSTPDDRQRIDRDSHVIMLLKPEVASMNVQVQGFNVVLGRDSPLTNVVVELEGVAFDNPDQVVVPTRVGETFRQGQMQFTNLPAIPWRIIAKRLGYHTTEMIVTPGPDGALPATIPLALPLADTGIDVVLESPLNSRELKNRSNDVPGRFHDGLFVVLQGIPESSTEGITRFGEAVYDEAEGKPVVRFRQLLPGNYRVFVPQGSGAISPYVYARDGRDTQLFVGFTGSDVVSAVLDEVTSSRLQITPIPARVRGKLMVADERGLGGEPVYQPSQQAGIVFSEYELADLFGDEVSVEAAADDSGEFMVDLVPGFYGVSIPTMQNYVGAQVQITKRSDPTGSVLQGWPYSDPFINNDRPVWSQHHGLGMPLSSGEEYEIVFFVRRQIAHVQGSWAAAFEDRLRDLVLSWPQLTRRYLDLADAGVAELELGDGSAQTLKAKLESAVGENRGFFEFAAVPPGKHTLRLSHPRNETTTQEIEIPNWEAPGIKPNRNPLDFNEKFPFDTWSLDILGATYEGDNLPPIRIERWNGLEYRDLGLLKVPTILELVNQPGRFYLNDFRVSEFWWPNEPVNYWIFDNGMWHEGLYTPGTPLPLSVFSGGPDNSFSPDGPGFEGYDLTYHAYSLADPTLGVDNVEIITDSNDVLKIDAAVNLFTPVGTVVETGFKGDFSPNTINNPDGWVWEEFEGIEVETSFDEAAERFKIEVGVYMKRGMGLRGTVQREQSDGQVPFAEARVQVRDRYGKPLREAVTDGEGKFQITPSFESPQTLFVEISMPGYQPWRRRVSALGVGGGGGEENPPVVAVDDIVLKPLPQPTLIPDSITMDRKGLFLAGVSARTTLNPLDNEDQLRQALSLSWGASAKSETVTLSLPKYDRPDGSSGGIEQLDLSDPIVALWIIDPRAFDQNPLADRPRPLSVPASSDDPSARLRWMREITDGTHPNVFSQRITEISSPDGDGVVLGDGTIRLWELPVGDFVPIFAAVTQRGAVRFYSGFQQNAGEQLTGVVPPNWIASTLAHASLTNITDASARTESERLQANGRITVGPLLEAKIEQTNGFLRYDYGVSVNWKDGTGSPQTGLWTLAPGFMGFRFGGKANFGVKGDERKVFFESGKAINFQAKFTGDGEATFEGVNWKDYANPLVVGAVAKGLTSAVPVQEVNIGVNLSWKDSQTTWSDSRFPYDFESVHTVSGGLSMEAKQNLAAVVKTLSRHSWMPKPIGRGVKKVIEKIPDAVDAFFSVGGGVGGSFKTTSRSVRPFIVENQLAVGQGNTVTPLELPPAAKGAKGPLRRHVAGGLEVNNEFQLCYRFDAGGGVEAWGGRLGATLKVIADGDQEDCPWEAVTIRPHLSGGWPFFDKAGGKVRIEAEAYANLSVIKLQTKWIVPVIEFKYERGTEPFFGVVPVASTSVALSPATALPSVFAPDAEAIVSKFYDPGVCHLVAGENDVLVYTDVNASSQMAIQLSVALGNGSWSLPVTLAQAPGILDTAFLGLADGRRLLVWSELDASGIGSLNPSSRLRFRVGSADGITWSDPGEVASFDGPIQKIQLIDVGGTPVLVGGLQVEEAFSPNQTLIQWQWVGDVWSNAATVVSGGSVAEWETVGGLTGVGGVGLLAVVSASGETSVSWIDGMQSTAITPVIDSGVSLVDLAWLDDRVAMVSDEVEGALSLRTVSFAGEWSEPTLVAEGVTALDVEVSPFGESDLALAWISGGNPVSVNAVGWNVSESAPIGAPRLLYESSNRLSGLQILAENNGVRALFKEGGDSVAIRQRTGVISDAPVIESLEFFENGELGFVIQLLTGATYRLEGSADLESWETLVESEVVEAPWRVTDSQNQNRDWQFYRVVRVEP